jgi:hypothetical protein
MFWDQRQGCWLKTAIDDPRANHLLARKGSAIEGAWNPNDIPEAPTLSDKERKALVERNVDWHRRSWLSALPPADLLVR